MQARKTTHGLVGQHQYVDRTIRGRVSQWQIYMEKVPYVYGVANPRDRGRLKNRTEVTIFSSVWASLQNMLMFRTCMPEYWHRADNTKGTGLFPWRLVVDEDRTREMCNRIDVQAHAGRILAHPNPRVRVRIWPFDLRVSACWGLAMGYVSTDVGAIAEAVFLLERRQTDSQSDVTERSTPHWRLYSRHGNELSGWFFPGWGRCFDLPALTLLVGWQKGHRPVESCATCLLKFFQVEEENQGRAVVWRWWCLYL